MIQNLLKSWKTTSAGLALIVGNAVHLVFAIKGHTADEMTWTVSITAIIGGLGLMFAGDASQSTPVDPPATTSNPAAKVGLLLLFGALIFSPLVLTTGCALFKDTATPQAKVYYSFLDTWTLAKAAYDSFEERVVMPGSKVTKENSDKVDVAWNKFRVAFQTSMGLARQNWNAPAPADLLAIKADLLKLIATLSK